MLAEELVDSYPRLFHIAWEGSWPNIRRYGLLSTQNLLELYQVDGQEADSLVGEHRSHWVEIERGGLPRAVIRDQKPMSDDGVRRALGDDVQPAAWYRLLNSMVFFWPTKKRLLTMMGAGAYRGMRHDLIVVDTEILLSSKEDDVRLSPMNSGATKPFPHPRSMDLFKRIQEYPFEERMRKCRLEGAVAEVCVLNGVEEIEDCVVDVRTVTAEEANAWL